MGTILVSDTQADCNLQAMGPWPRLTITKPDCRRRYIPKRVILRIDIYWYRLWMAVWKRVRLMCVASSLKAVPTGINLIFFLRAHIFLYSPAGLNARNSGLYLSDGFDFFFRSQWRDGRGSCNAARQIKEERNGFYIAVCSDYWSVEQNRKRRHIFILMQYKSERLTPRIIVITFRLFDDIN